MYTGCSFEAWENYLFITVGYFWLHTPKYIAKFPYAWDILVDSNTIQIQQLPLETLKFFGPRVSNRKIKKTQIEINQIFDKIWTFLT